MVKRGKNNSSGKIIHKKKKKTSSKLFLLLAFAILGLVAFSFIPLFPGNTETIDRSSGLPTLNAISFWGYLVDIPIASQKSANSNSECQGENDGKHCNLKGSTYQGVCINRVCVNCQPSCKDNGCQDCGLGSNGPACLIRDSQCNLTGSTYQGVCDANGECINCNPPCQDNGCQDCDNIHGQVACKIKSGQCNLTGSTYQGVCDANGKCLGCSPPCLNNGCQDCQFNAFGLAVCINPANINPCTLPDGSIGNCKNGMCKGPCDPAPNDCQYCDDKTDPKNPIAKPDPGKNGVPCSMSGDSKGTKSGVCDSNGNCKKPDCKPSCRPDQKCITPPNGGKPYCQDICPGMFLCKGLVCCMNINDCTGNNYVKAFCNPHSCNGLSSDGRPLQLCPGDGSGLWSICCDSGPGGNQACLTSTTLLGVLGYCGQKDPCTSPEKACGTFKTGYMCCLPDNCENGDTSYPACRITAESCKKGETYYPGGVINGKPTGVCCKANEDVIKQPNGFNICVPKTTPTPVPVPNPSPNPTTPNPNPTPKPSSTSVSPNPTIIPSPCYTITSVPKS